MRRDDWRRLNAANNQSWQVNSDDFDVHAEMKYQQYAMGDKYRLVLPLLPTISSHKATSAIPREPKNVFRLRQCVRACVCDVVSNARLAPPPPLPPPSPPLLLLHPGWLADWLTG